MPPLKLTTVPVALSLLAGAPAAVLTLAAPAAAVPPPDPSCAVREGSVRSITIAGGTSKQVGVIQGSWGTVGKCLDGSKTNSPSPWWGSNSLAKDYAQAYAAVTSNDWLYPNGDPATLSGPKNVGPLAAWRVNGSGKVQAWAVRQVGNGNGNGNGNGGGAGGLNGNEFVVDPNETYFWLVDPLGDADPVPAPLPLLGGMMALLWSRRLRRRIARGQRAAG